MLVDHIDVHVASLEAGRRIFDSFMPALGLGRVSVDSTSCTYYPQGADQPFFGLMVGGDRSAGSMRVAFAACDRDHVNHLAKIIIAGGARNVEGPQIWSEYSEDYYAAFFEDDDGNRYEICHRGP